MRLFINDEEITIHHGATVIDAVRAYYVQHNKKLPYKLPIVCDTYGNSMALDGALNDGNYLHIKTINSTMKTITTKLKVFCGLVVLGAFLLMACSTNRKVAELPQSKTVEILAVNDMHAAIDNFPRFAFMADSLRAIYPHLLLVSELINIKLSDLHFNDEYIKVTGKGNKERLVPISKRAITEIGYYLIDRNQKEPDNENKDFLFLNRSSKKLTRVMIFTITLP